MSHLDLTFKDVWAVVWPASAILLTGLTTYYFFRKSKRHVEWRGYAQQIHDTLVPLHEIIGVYYAHGLEYASSAPFKTAIDKAAELKLIALKLGHARYQRWNQAVMSAAQCHLAYRLDISGESVTEWEVAYHSPEELMKRPERFAGLVLAAQRDIDASLADITAVRLTEGRT